MERCERLQEPTGREPNESGITHRENGCAQNTALYLKIHRLCHSLNWTGGSISSFSDGVTILKRSSDGGDRRVSVLQDLPQRTAVGCCWLLFRQRSRRGTPGQALLTKTGRLGRLLPIKSSLSSHELLQRPGFMGFDC